MFNNKNYDICIFFILLTLSVVIRAGLFYTHWGDFRHGSSLSYGSTAIGSFFGHGLTYNDLEKAKIKTERNNYSGNYLEFYVAEDREPLTEFLPGPSILLSWLWKVLPVYNFSPYIWLQILLESFLISSFYFTIRRDNKIIFLITTMLMMVNPITIKYTLTMGYDFWPLFCVLVNFIGVSLALNAKRNRTIILLTGMLTAITIWFRSITNFFPFYIAILLFFYWRCKNKQSYRKISINIALYLIPIIISMVSLSVCRHELTGNYRPTRSTFWHSFWAGVGQFSNPYDLVSVDNAIWEFGKKLNKQLENYSLSEMSYVPDSLYENTLKDEAFRFCKEYPYLLIRNTLYRITIMIAPVMYKHGTFIPERFSSYLFPLGFLLIVLWFFGMYDLFRHNYRIFLLSLTVYAYFFSTLGIFYIVGRAILPFLFINIFVYLYGLKSCIRIAKKGYRFIRINTEHLNILKFVLICVPLFRILSLKGYSKSLCDNSHKN